MLKSRWFCAHCGAQLRDYAFIQSYQVCNTCYHLVKGGEELGSRLPEGTVLVDVKVTDLVIAVPASELRWRPFLTRHGR